MSDTSEAPITKEEMMQLFGEHIPMEAVKLLWGVSDDMTVGELRARLRQIAHERIVDARMEAIARAICEADGNHPDSDWRSQGGVFLTVADPHPEMWRRYLKHAEAAAAAMSKSE